MFFEQTKGQTLQIEIYPNKKKINNAFNQIDTTVFYHDYLFIKCKQSVGNNLKVTR